MLSSPRAAEVGLTCQDYLNLQEGCRRDPMCRDHSHPRQRHQGRCCFNAPEEGWRGSAPQADPCWPLAALLQPLSPRSHCCPEQRQRCFIAAKAAPRVVVLNSRPVHPWDGIFPLASSGIATEKPFISLVCTSNLRGALLRLPLSAVSTVLNEAAILRPNEFEKFLTLLLQCLK